MIDYVAPVLIVSPCVGVCVIDDRDQCEGCGRTLDEIADWVAMGPARRDTIMAMLPARLSHDERPTGL